MSSHILTGAAALQGEQMVWTRTSGETAQRPAQGPRDLPPEQKLSQEQELQARLAELEREAAAREQSALRAGLEQGRAAGEREATARLEAAIERFAAGVHELAQRRKQIRHEAERDVVKLSIAIARRILHRELTTDPEAMLGLVKSALEKIDTREVDRVRVHPADAAAVRGQLERLRPTAHFEVLADASLERGAALFEGARGNLDASIEMQLAEIERGLTDRLRT